MLVLFVTAGGNPAKKKAELETPVSRMLVALGGEKFLGLTGFQLAGRGYLAGGNPVRIRFAQEGEKLRTQIETNFWSSTEVFDGASGWRRFGREKAFKVAESPLKLFSQEGLARIQKIQADSFTLERDTVLGKTSCLWVKTFDSTAGELWIFLDRQTYRPRGLFSPGAGFSAGLAAYEPVQGIWFPYVVSLRHGAQSYLELTLDSVSINPALPDSFFAFPEK